jgi:hypothetical protein
MSSKAAQKDNRRNVYVSVTPAGVGKIHLAFKGDDRTFCGKVVAGEPDFQLTPTVDRRCKKCNDIGGIWGL